MPRPITIEEFGRNPQTPLTSVDLQELVPLPPPYDKTDGLPKWKEVSAGAKERVMCNLDGVVALALPKPQNEREEKEAVDRFVSGLRKLLSKENNWTFLQPLVLSLSYCARCQTCNDACPIFTASGRNDVYRPTYRSEIWRRLVRRYVQSDGGVLSRWLHGDLDLNWTTLSRLYELCYRCTMCRRCAQACPMGVDNALITHELRKLFSQELGWAPKELHEKGTALQLLVGSSTGMNPEVAKDNVTFIGEELTEETGLDANSKWDQQGAEVLIIHNAGEMMAWPENPAAFAIILNAARVNWTLASEAPSYDGVNYGLFYDDFQLARIALKHAQTAKKLGVKKLLMGECGHQHKAMMTISDRILLGDLNVHKESFLPFLEHLIDSGKLQLDPSKNDFPVTLHDPCNLTRNLGIIEPQRRILRKLCPKFREMEPHGAENYCCGGGSGFAIMSGNNFADWRSAVASRVKFKQVLDAFADCPGPEVKKYVCAPCSNCKGAFRDMFAYYGAQEKSGIIYGGLVELIVNAMVGIKRPYVKWEEE